MSENMEEIPIPISISNFIFYKMHKSCFGLTGTLGSKIERESIKEIYDMDSFDVPTHKPRIRVDTPPVIYPTTEMQLQEALKSVKACRDQGRPVLILCETINESEIVEEVLKNANVPFEMFNETQKKSGEEIIENAGKPGAVTVATNNAGRGTDIKLRGASLQNGGLHVILLFYPGSGRVEDQGRGRGGRQGEPGSSEMILSAKKLNLSPSQQVLDSTEILEILSLRRQMQISRNKHNSFCRSQIEREIFALASDFYSDLAKFHELLENSKFLREQAEPLSTRRLIENKDKDFYHLNIKDRQIAKDAYNLILEGGSVTCWTNVLKQTIKRIEKKLIADWAIYFYQPAQVLVDNAKLNENVSIAQLLDLLKEESDDSFSDVQDLFLKTTQLKIEDLLEEIKKLYNERRVEWSKYLESDGVMFYLREMTGLSLVNIGNSPHLPEQKKPVRAQIPHIKADVKEKAQAPSSFVRKPSPRVQNESVPKTEVTTLGTPIVPDAISLEDGFEFNRLTTVGDGSCGIHALNGELDANNVCFAPAFKEDRKEIADWLRVKHKEKTLPQCLKTNLVDYMANPAKAPQVFKEDPIIAGVLAELNKLIIKSGRDSKGKPMWLADDYKRYEEERTRILFEDNIVFEIYLKKIWEDPSKHLLINELAVAAFKYGKKVIIIQPEPLAVGRGKLQVGELCDKAEADMKENVDLNACLASGNYTFIYYNGHNHYERAELSKKA